ncbi:MAG: TetR family transcriptional regulator [Rhizobiaceae bacterium]|nr:TetR family transcriptional regulator [Rhizobiaceae bacterium]
MAELKSDRATKSKLKRDPVATKERILRAGLAEFGSKGYGGARIASIVKKARCNTRMLYHYFGGKKELYLACLERVYSKIRQEEQNLDLLDMDPIDALQTLVQFTFDHMRNNPDFVHIAGVENTQKGKFLKRLPPVSNAAHDLIETIDEILKRGVKAGVMKGGVDAFQLYVSILALSYLHLSNRYTLSVSYGRDIEEEAWLDERKLHVRDLILSHVVR